MPKRVKRECCLFLGSTPSFFLVVGLLLFACSPAVAQASGPPSRKPGRVSLKINALPVLFGSFNLFGELPVSKTVSASVGLNYWYSPKGTLIFNRFDQQQSGALLEFRKYADTSANSLYVGVYGRYRQVFQKRVVNYIADSLGINSIETRPQDQRWNQLGAGLLLGYRHPIGRGFLVDAFVGGGYYFYQNLKTDRPDWITDYSRVSRIDIRVGICFGIVF